MTKCVSTRQELRKFGSKANDYMVNI